MSCDSKLGGRLPSKRFASWCAFIGGGCALIGAALFETPSADSSQPAASFAVYRRSTLPTEKLPPFIVPDGQLDPAPYSDPRRAEVRVIPIPTWDMAQSATQLIPTYAPGVEVVPVEQPNRPAAVQLKRIHATRP